MQRIPYSYVTYLTVLVSRFVRKKSHKSFEAIESIPIEKHDQNVTVLWQKVMNYDLVFNWLVLATEMLLGNPPPPKKKHFVSCTCNRRRCYFVGPFLLTHLLLDLIHASPDGGRIVNITCEAHRHVRVLEPSRADDWGHLSLSRFTAYAVSKACLQLFSHKLSLSLAGKKTTASYR